MGGVKKLTNNKSKPEPRKRSLPAVQDVVVDLGNSIIKIMVRVKDSWQYICYPHAMRKITTFDQITARQKRGLDATIDLSMFEYEGEARIVGSNAELDADPARSGGPKYRPDYYPFLLLKGLIEAFPKGHDNLRLMALFPPGDHRHVETLMDSLGGRHVVTLVDGRKVEYRVREVFTLDEPVGGLRNYLLADDGVHWRTNTIDSRLGLCVDVGGKISNLTPFRADGFVDYDKATSVDLGIQDVMRNVSTIILNDPKNAEMLEMDRGSVLPFDSEMRRALQDKIYGMGGYDLAVADVVNEGTRELLNGLRQRLAQVGGIRPYSYIVVTGGGGGLLFYELVSQVFAPFNPQKVYLSHPHIDEMHLANVFGAAKTLNAMLAKV
jgi:hypothetical protein